MNQKQWWYNIGSGIQPLKNDDMESHAERISQATWPAAVASVFAEADIDCFKPNSEKWIKISVDGSGNLKIEEIPINKIMKDIE